jgi:hypothetical protein
MLERRDVKKPKLNIKGDLYIVDRSEGDFIERLAWAYFDDCPVMVKEGKDELLMDTIMVERFMTIYDKLDDLNKQKFVSLSLTRLGIEIEVIWNKFDLTNDYDVTKSCKTYGLLDEY